MTVSERIEALKQTVRANGTELYCEQRGSGPPVLFIAGATGGAGHFDVLAEQLADEFTVISYDRRGNSRSPAPDGWTDTSIEQQADDAAGLITTLGLGRVGVFGTSGGGAIGLELVRRHPGLVVGAVLHEPFLPHVLGDQWAQIDVQNKATFGPILESRGPRALMEAILRAMRGDAGFEALDEALRERMLGNAEAFLLEDAAYPRYRPDDAALAAIRHPVRVLLGEAGAPWAPPMATWLAERLGTEVTSVPGGHGAYLDERGQLAAALRPHLRAITGVVDHVPADESADPYNYAAYDFALEQPEYARWLQEGPHVDQPAPDFVLADLAGDTVRLGDLRGHPVVLEFGSYTCSIFSDRVPAMEQLAREHGEATFLVIYVREAHPGEHQRPHRSLAEKRSAAHKLAMEEGLARRVLVDTLDGATHRAYGGAWNPVYVIGPDGRIAMRQAWNHPQDVAAVLDALKAGFSPTPDPELPESIEMLRETSRRPMGQRLLERGGIQALEDFYRSAPAPIQEALRNSPSAEVRTNIAAFDRYYRANAAHKED